MDCESSTYPNFDDLTQIGLELKEKTDEIQRLKSFVSQLMTEKLEAENDRYFFIHLCMSGHSVLYPSIVRFRIIQSTTIKVGRNFQFKPFFYIRF